MEDRLANENQIHWPGLAWQGADLAELEARDGDHTFGRPGRLVDWTIAVDKRVVVGSHAVNTARLHRPHRYVGQRATPVN